MTALANVLLVCGNGLCVDCVFLQAFLYGAFYVIGLFDKMLGSLSVMHKERICFLLVLFCMYTIISILKYIPSNTVRIIYLLLIIVLTEVKQLSK